MALYSMYKKEGEAFVPKYVNMLESGGLYAPQELLGQVGIDINDPEFWRGGMKVVDQLIADFEKIYAEYKAQK
jgi:oligoendopeptidase F